MHFEFGGLIFEGGTFFGILLYLSKINKETN